MSGRLRLRLAPVILAALLALTPAAAVADVLTTATDSSSVLCTEAACVEEQRERDGDCSPNGWGTNRNATHAHLLTPLTYTVVTAYDTCAGGNWWQQNRGLVVAQHAPGLRLAAGGYTYTQDGVDHTDYYVLVGTPAGGQEVRWMGTSSPTDSTCAARVAASAPYFRLWDTFPCPLPPPSFPKAAWPSLLP